MTLDWSVEVDRDTCIGSGMCVNYAPATFAQDGDDAKVVLLDSSTDDVDTVSIAVEACPTSAIRLVEGSG